MLATSTTSASGYMWYSASSTTPPRIVLGAPRPNRTTVSTGYRLAGMYSTAPVTTRAQHRPSGLRLRCSSPLSHRGHTSPSSLRLIRPQTSHAIVWLPRLSGSAPPRRPIASHIATSSSQVSAHAVTSIRTTSAYSARSTCTSDSAASRV